MLRYITDFIPQNVANPSSNSIGIYNPRGKMVGQIPLGVLAMPATGKKRYSFAAFSDVHVVYSTAADDLRRALRYVNEVEKVEFTCICGDLTDDGTEEQLAQYKAIVDECSLESPVYAIAGNHEFFRITSATYLENYTGKPLYYTFEHENDLFVMLGIMGPTEGMLFEDGELAWLRNTLEANKNKKRIFLFMHIPAVESCGDVLNIYPYTKLGTHAESLEFKSIIQSFPNIIFFHGHTHMMFSMQEHGALANYDSVFGCHSVHIPSLAVPRKANAAETGYETYYAGSEGYIVDVYENGIHLRGRDFAKGEFLPIASYWLDTALEAKAAGACGESAENLARRNIAD